MENDNINRIQRVSGQFHWLSSLLIYCIALMTSMYWLFYNQLPAGLTTELPVVVRQSLGFETRLLAFLVSLIPASVAIYGLINLKNLLQLYGQAVVFSEHNVRCFARLGYTLIAWVLANLIYVVLVSIVLTFNNPPGERMVVAQFGIADVGTLTIGAVVVLVSWVMKEAVTMQQEQELTV